MIGKIRDFFVSLEDDVYCSNTHTIMNNMLDRIEELEMNVMELEQKIDLLSDLRYNLRDYTLGK